tara:strand:+ start:750 stop:1472 length:723 start_codon:yes stop_codon:yes gene_type:complete
MSSIICNNIDEKLLLHWFKESRRADSLSEEEAEELYLIFKGLGFKTITSLTKVGWDTITNSAIEERFYPWLSCWLPRSYISQNFVLEGGWEDSFKGRKCTIKKCVDDYMEKVGAPKNPDLLETWWEGCIACNDEGSDPHDYRHPACMHNSKSDNYNKEVFEKMREIKSQNYTLYYVIDEEGGYNKKAVITFHHDTPTKVTLRAPWGKNGALRTWEGEICDNQTKIKWTGRRGTSFWYKTS